MSLREVLLASALILTSVSAFASDQWIHYQGNPAHTGYVPIQTNLENYKTLWSDRLDQLDLGEPTARGREGMIKSSAIAENKIFLLVYQRTRDDSSGNTHLIALDINTGKKLWDKVLSNDDGPGSMTYARGNLFVSMLDHHYDGHTVKMHQWLNVYDAKQGKLVRTLPLADGLFDGYLQYAFDLYIVINPLRKDGYGGPEVIDYNLNSGKPNWVRKSFHSDKSALSRDHVIQQTINGVEVFNRHSGKKLFKIDVSEANSDPYYPANKMPVLDLKHNLVYMVLQTGKTYSLYALDLGERLVRWSVPLQGHSVQPVVAGDEVYSISASGLRFYAINAVTGKINWSWMEQENGDEISPLDMTQPMLVTDDVVLVANKDQQVLAISRKTHKLVKRIYAGRGKVAIVGDKLIHIDNQIGNRDLVNISVDVYKLK